MIWRPSPNFDDRDTAIDTLVLHYTGMQTEEAALERLTDKTAEVSAHFLVEENGDVFHLVKEEKRAWHAGVSYWRGATNINARSIGIEIVNPGHEFGYRSFPAPQMQAVTALALDIIDRHAISQRNVIGHSDIAPQRKSDPGELFGWQVLAEQGVGFWFDNLSADSLLVPSLKQGDDHEKIAALRDSLDEIGYDATGNNQFDAELTAVMMAFQRHWRPSLIDGLADAETQAVIFAVRDAVRRLT